MLRAAAGELQESLGWIFLWFFDMLIEWRWKSLDQFLAAAGFVNLGNGVWSRSLPVPEPPGKHSP